jgi:hypothetical protein
MNMDTGTHGLPRSPARGKRHQAPVQPAFVAMNRNSPASPSTSSPRHRTMAGDVGFLDDFLGADAKNIDL